VIGLRLLLIVDALAIAAASGISDPIVRDVAVAPAILVGILLAIACLSADLVPPRHRTAVICSVLTLVLPIPCLLLPQGPRVAAAAIIVLQVIPLVRREAGGLAVPTALRRIVGALVIVTAVLLIAVVALVWYGSTYLIKPPQAAFQRGPYLTRLTMTEADFAWQVKAGQPPVQLQVSAPDGATRAAVGGRLTGLSPATRYEWTANLGGVSAAAGAFTTAPATTASPITLVSFGDYGSGNAHEYAVARLAAAAAPRLFLSSGDNAYLLAAPPFLDRAIFQPLAPLLAQAPAVAALGEHDLAWNDGSAVITALHLPGHHYAAQYGPVQVVVLGLQADASALAYARQALGRCSPACPVRYVLVHRPIAASNPITGVLRQYHVAAILAGHLHRYERQIVNGVLEFTVGTGGEGAGSAQFTPRTPGAQVSLLTYGFLRIDILGQTIRYRFVNDRGQTLDAIATPITG
jgi:hypothetical protein